MIGFDALSSDSHEFLNQWVPRRLADMQDNLWSKCFCTALYCTCVHGKIRAALSSYNHHFGMMLDLNQPRKLREYHRAEAHRFGVMLRLSRF